VLLADISDVGRILVLGQEVVERLVAGGAQLLGDRLVPFFTVGKDRIDVEHYAAEVEQLVLDDVADREARFRVARGFDPAARLSGIELRTLHGHGGIDYLAPWTRFPPGQSPARHTTPEHAGLGKPPRFR